jgi:hypothetical protein
MYFGRMPRRNRRAAAMAIHAQTSPSERDADGVHPGRGGG